MVQRKYPAYKKSKEIILTLTWSLPMKSTKPKYKSPAKAKPKLVLNKKKTKMRVKKK